MLEPGERPRPARPRKEAFDEVLPDAAKAWADTFTPDGQFTLLTSSGAIQKKANGTKQLIALHGELAKPEKRHWYTNLLIEPERGGARMQSYLITLVTEN